MGSAASSPRRATGSPPPFTSADLANTVLSSVPPATHGQPSQGPAGGGTGAGAGAGAIPLPSPNPNALNAPPAPGSSASTTSTLVSHSPTQPQQTQIHSPRPIAPAAPRPIPPTTAHPSGLGPDGLPISSSLTHPRSSTPGSGSVGSSTPGSATRPGVPDPRRKKSLELPDLASLALTPVSVPPPGPSRPIAGRDALHPHSHVVPPQQRADVGGTGKYNELAYGYPPGASNVSPSAAGGGAAVVTGPGRRPSRGRQASDTQRRASAPAAPPQKELRERDRERSAERARADRDRSGRESGLDSRPPSPGGMGVIYSHLPTGLPERVVEPEQEEEEEGSLPEPRTVLRWEGGGREVLLAGTFLDMWQGRERMQWDPSTNSHVLSLVLPPGLHRFKFIIDGEWRCSPSYEQATDPQGNLINTLYIPPPPSPPPPVESPSPLQIRTTTPTPVSSETQSRQQSRQQTPTLRQSVSAEDALGGRWDSNPRSDIITEAYSPLWTSTPPPILSSIASSPSNRTPQLPPPPALPRHLERVILNAADRPGGQADGEDNSILPLPNHVVLNHLTASAIRGGVMAVGITGRYSSKLVTTIYYRPVGL